MRDEDMREMLHFGLSGSVLRGYGGTRFILVPIGGVLQCAGTDGAFVFIVCKEKL